jgi:prepilin-type N-terminal cleavage/methylation domain-containing protein/prepilin-type processing-associated H-X9-DG protein
MFEDPSRHRRARRRSPGFTLVELLVVIACIGLLVGMLLPAVQRSREAARRTHCQNNLRQVGLALLHFHDNHGSFPASGWTKVGPGNPYGKYVGWRALILPLLEQANLQDAYDFELHWWEGTNPATGTIAVSTFRCPSVPAGPAVLAAVPKPPRPALTFPAPLAPTDYEAVMGVQPASIDPVRYGTSNRFAVMHRNSQVRMGDIRDGTSNTIMVIECAGRPQTYRMGRPMAQANDQGLGWVDSEGPFSLDGSNADGSLEGCTPAHGCQYAMNRRNDNEPYSFHTGGIHALFADGHVQFLAEQLDLLTMAALCTRAAGEVVDLSRT